MELFRSTRPFNQEMLDKIDSNICYNHAWKRSCLIHSIMFKKEFLSKEKIVDLIIEHSENFKYSSILKDMKDIDFIINFCVCLGMMEKCDQ